MSDQKQMLPWPDKADYTTYNDEDDGANESVLDEAAYHEARAEAAMARLRYLAREIQKHNEACDEMCGIGEQEGVACKYRPYFPRRCPDCAKDHKLDWLEVVGPLPPETGKA